jgi:hypothetical protein
MPVGATIGSGQVDNIITNLAVNLRNIMRQISDLNLAVNGQAQGLAYLTAIGYSNTANPANPNNKSDAQLALDTIAYLNTVAGCYFGTVQQGGTGGTGASTFNFNQQLAAVWGGQVALQGRGAGWTRPSSSPRCR